MNRSPMKSGLLTACIRWVRRAHQALDALIAVRAAHPACASACPTQRLGAAETISCFISTTACLKPTNSA